ncbi:uncharacterized protein LOC133922911 [Phragmites australis]|uniref:uncharacterized protein LOC133922911 n=1 Tax=Phragmites australis TaxID=29695 RepID=UPI002D78FC74|nr:uncharacterized protein LOC133922911 [Phragmites australis]
MRLSHLEPVSMQSCGDHVPWFSSFVAYAPSPDPKLLLRQLLGELGHNHSKATVVFCDNVSACYMSNNPVHHKRTKHIELDVHFVREKVAIGECRVLQVPTTQQFADVMTKGLPTASFNGFRSSLCVSGDSDRVVAIILMLPWYQPSPDPKLLLRQLLGELGHNHSKATVVFCDNVSACYMSNNPVHHKRTKHIELDVHFVREKVAIGECRVLQVPTTQQFADVMTKGLPTASFNEF